MQGLEIVLLLLHLLASTDPVHHQSVRVDMHHFESVYPAPGHSRIPPIFFRMYTADVHGLLLSISPAGFLSVSLFPPRSEL